MTALTEDLIKQAIQAARAGDRHQAQALLNEAVQQEPQNAHAWYLLSQVADTHEEAVRCLERVLEIVPDNAQAQSRLASIKARPYLARPETKLSSLSKPKKRGWQLWLGLGILVSTLAILGLYLLAVTLAGVLATPTPAPAWSYATQISNQPGAFVFPPTWTPKSTPGTQATSTLAPALTLSLIPPSATMVPVLTPFPRSTGSYSSYPQVHFIDVGQGDATLILSPEGKTILIDGGEADTGVVEYLKGLGVNRIDLMVATHPHSDHIGGLVQVLQYMSVAKVVTNGQPNTTSTYENFLDAIASDQVEYVEVKRGDTISAGSLVFTVLNPESNTGDDLNNNSLVLRLVYGNVAFLFEGDAEKDAEVSILGSGLPVQAQILKVGHHGDRAASSPDFLARVEPEIAVYFAGAGNEFGYPHPETLEALRALGAQVYGTDQDGTIVVTTDGNSYTVSSRRAQASPTPTMRPTATEFVEPLTLDIVTVTSPVARGEKATLIARTLPGAKCTITVYYKSGPSDASGLDPKVADGKGKVSWTWKVAGSVPPGTYKIVVTANLYGQSITRSTTFVVKR
jgi:competence protein ComEC